MTLGTATLLTATISAANATATSGSFTPSANQTIYAAGTSRRTVANGTPTQPSITDSTGSLTWTAIDEATLSGATANLRLRLWRTAVGASPVAMTVSIAGSGTETHSVTLVGIVAAGTDDSNRITGTNSTGDCAVTLPNTPVATSTTIGFTFCNSTGVVTQPSGYTELEDISTSNGRVETVSLAGNTSTGLTWSSANNDAVAIALEVKLLKFTAAIAATTVAATAAVTAKQKFSAAIAATTQPANASITAKQRFSAAIAATTQPATAAITVKQKFSAAIAATGQPANASVTATNTAPASMLPEHCHRRPRPIGIGIGYGL